VTRRGRFIALEGVDGCGKSTQVQRVAAARDALATFEPGDTELGAALRSVALDNAVSMTPLTEVLVMAADRAEHVAQVIEPALAAGRDVVCDRFSGSTIAYQGHGRGVALDVLRPVLDAAARGLEPDVTILLDCPPGIAARRRRNRAERSDRFEATDPDFVARVRGGFLALAAATASWRVVDAAQSLDGVTRDVDAAIREVLG
jgi:dTMP kinase